MPGSFVIRQVNHTVRLDSWNLHLQSGIGRTLQNDGTIEKWST
jgi:hypothetical protein